VNLIITVDCGIRDDKIVQYATEKGIDVIITDHHDVPEIIPQTAIAVINSKRIDCPYPYKNLA
jgi:single-stranded-DNA-specific exonuclease